MISTSVCVCVCVCVCLSVCLQGYLRNCMQSLLIFLCMLPMAMARSSGRVTKFQGEGADLGVSSPLTINCTAFGTHTKTAEPIEMSFGTMTWVGHRYHVLHGGPNSPRGRGSFRGENVVVHCKVIRYSSVSCAKMAEPIGMPFWMKTWVEPRNHVLDEAADPQWEGQFSGVVRAIRKHWLSLVQPLVQCLVQRNHPIANNVVQQKRSFSMPGKCKYESGKFLGAGDAACQPGRG